MQATSKEGMLRPDEQCMNGEKIPTTMTTTKRNDDKYRWCGVFLVRTCSVGVLFYTKLSAWLQFLVALSFSTACAAKEYKLCVSTLYIYMCTKKHCVLVLLMTSKRIHLNSVTNNQFDLVWNIYTMHSHSNIWTYTHVYAFCVTKDITHLAFLAGMATNNK